MSHAACKQIDSTIQILEISLILFQSYLKVKKTDVTPKEKIQESAAIEARTNSIKF